MIKKIIVSILTLSFFACSGTKKMTTNNTDSDKPTQSKNAKMEQVDKTTKTADNSTVLDDKATGGIAAQVNGSTGGMDKVQVTGGMTSSGADFEQMYTDLEMTDDQIRTFRSAMKNFQNTQVSKPNGEMMGSIENERTRQLQNILTKAQFAKYKKWELNNK